MQTLKSFFSPIPYLIFFVTGRCNARCKMCFYWQEIDSASQEDELTLKEIEKISSHWGRLYYLSLGGGEPTLRGDLDQIADIFIKGNGAKIVHFSTNCTNPKTVFKVTKSIAQRHPAILVKVALSLDGVADRHDEIRGVKGLFKKVVETERGLRRLRQLYGNIGVDATTVFCKYNEDEIDRIIDFVEKKMEVDGHYITLVRGRVKDEAIKDVDLSRYADALERTKKLKTKKEDRLGSLQSFLYKAAKITARDFIEKTATNQRLYLPCVAGTKMIEIYENGDVCPCEILNQKIGNLREVNYDIKKILATPKAKKTIRAIKDSRCFCSFECAMQANVVYRWQAYPTVLANIAKLLVK